MARTSFNEMLSSPYLMESPAITEMERHATSNATRLKAPIIVGWLLTTKCQLHCRHCWLDHQLPETNVDGRRRIAENLSKAGVCRVCLSGGEATLLEDLPILVRILKQSGIPICLYTNAQMPLSSGKTLKMFDHWHNTVDYIMVSLDGGNCKDFERQRGYGTFGRFVDNVTSLRNRGVRILAHFIASPFNRARVHSAARLAYELGCEAFAADMVFPRGRAALISHADICKTSRLYFESICHLLADGDLTNSHMQFSIFLPVASRIPADLNQAMAPHIKPPLLTRLRDGISQCFILPDGKVVPSVHLHGNKKYACGSLLKRDFSSIWSNARGFNNMPLSRDLHGTRCEHCHEYHWCMGGHWQRAWEHYGTVNAPDPWCSLGQEGA